jgi:hypothetical protein
MPIDTGIPVHHSTAARSALASASSRAPRPAHAEKSFVDRIDFEIGREGAQHIHHPAAHIAVERVVARAHDHTGRRETHAVQVPRRPHLDAERLRLVAARDHAAVIVRQHDDRAAAHSG